MVVNKPNYIWRDHEKKSYYYYYYLFIFMFVYLINEPSLNKPSLNIITCAWISSLVCDLIKVLYNIMCLKYTHIKLRLNYVNL